MPFNRYAIPENTTKIKPENLYDSVNDGDILMCSGNSYFANLIKKFTDSIWSHTAFIIKSPLIGKILVCESVESIGTRIISMDSYTNNYNGSGYGYNGDLVIIRHSNFKKEMLKAIATRAIELMGHPYDYEEVARIAEKITLGGLIKKITGDKSCDLTLPDDDKKYICSEFLYECYKSVGLLLTINCLGFLSPSDLCNCNELNIVCAVDK